MILLPPAHTCPSPQPPLPPGSYQEPPCSWSCSRGIPVLPLSFKYVQGLGGKGLLLCSMLGFLMLAGLSMHACMASMATISRLPPPPPFPSPPSPPATHMPLQTFLGFLDQLFGGQADIYCPSHAGHDGAGPHNTGQVHSCRQP